MKGAIALAAGLRANKSLEELRISQNRIGDAGAKAFAECVKENLTLRVLDLEMNKAITDKTGKKFGFRGDLKVIF